MVPASIFAENSGTWGPDRPLAGDTILSCFRLAIHLLEHQNRAIDYDKTCTGRLVAVSILGERARKSARVRQNCQSIIWSPPAQAEALSSLLNDRLGALSPVE